MLNQLIEGFLVGGIAAMACCLAMGVAATFPPIGIVGMGALTGLWNATRNPQQVVIRRGR